VKEQTVNNLACERRKIKLQKIKKYIYLTSNYVLKLKFFINYEFATMKIKKKKISVLAHTFILNIYS
jgi:hypothetical protein